MQTLGREIQSALQRKEALLLTKERKCQVRSLFRVIRERQGLRDEDLCKLKEASGEVAGLLVPHHGICHRGREHRAHKREFLADRIQNAYRAECLTSLRIAEQL